jgi:hypothetical protein
MTDGDWLKERAAFLWFPMGGGVAVIVPCGGHGQTGPDVEAIGLLVAVGKTVREAIECARVPFTVQHHSRGVVFTKYVAEVGFLKAVDNMVMRLRATGPSA